MKMTKNEYEKYKDYIFQIIIKGVLNPHNKIRGEK